MDGSLKWLQQNITEKNQPLKPTSIAVTKSAMF